MSTYIISDVHGHLEKFKSMLELINFDEGCDRMIILGDVIDRGEENLKILQYIGRIISMHPEAIELLKGNHELFCEMFLKQQLSARKWQLFGGSETLEEVKMLSRQEQKELLKYLEALPHYKEITTKYGSTILTHSGLVIERMVENADGTINVKASIEKAINNDECEYLLSVDIHDMPTEKFDRFVIVGHTPVQRLNADMSYEIFRGEKYMDIDSGAGYPEGKLACYEVEMDTIYYV